jgi:hypothetical protein
MSLALFSGARPAPSVLDMLAAELAIWLVAGNIDLDGLIRSIRRLSKRRLSNHRASLSQFLLLPARLSHFRVLRSPRLPVLPGFLVWSARWPDRGDIARR